MCNVELLGSSFRLRAPLYASVDSTHTHLRPVLNQIKKINTIIDAHTVEGKGGGPRPPRANYQKTC